MLDRSMLARMLSGRVVVACVGNEWRGDDGVGPFVAKLLRSTDRVTILDCGETPENYLGVIVRLKPERVVVIDAADFGGKPGEVRVIARSEIGGGGVSTHAARLTILTDYVEAGAGAETFFLAIQPESTEFGRPLGAAVAAAAKEVAAEIGLEIRRGEPGGPGGPGRCGKGGGPEVPGGPGGGARPAGGFDLAGGLSILA
jgi:hydrogenase 3 maturation protease